MATVLTPTGAGTTFQDFIADITAEVDNANENLDANLRRATVRQLRELQTTRNSFMEASFTFNTQSDVGEYDSDVIGSWPPNILEIFLVYGEENEFQYEVYGPVPVRRIRLEWYQNVNYPWPELWAWHNNQLLLAPTPSSSKTIKFDYMEDATRDASSGDKITTSSTTETNGWFDRGENALRCAVLADYHASYSKDFQLAGMYRAQLRGALDSIEEEWHMLQGEHLQAAWQFGPDREGSWG